MRRKRDKEQNSAYSFIRLLPTDKLVWLAKSCLTEIDARLVTPQRMPAGPDPESKLHGNGRTLR